MKVALYSRVSTEKQDNQNQLRQLHEFCKSQQWNVKKEYIDVASGRNGDRDEFQALFAAASRREFDLVLFWSLDRFSREGVFQTLQYLQRLTGYGIGYVIRLLPEQYFNAKSTPRAEFLGEQATVKVGENAFVLYRSHESFEDFPPLENWEIRALSKEGETVTKRGAGVIDKGHYVLRLPTLGQKAERDEGPPQGLFATEYCDEDTNYLCKCVLAWLTIQTKEGPYNLEQAEHLVAILSSDGLGSADEYATRGAVREGQCSCPLCLRVIKYDELHQMVTFDDASGLGNAGTQIEGATRSTAVNLFHIEPLIYKSLVHVPSNVAWGHAVCNTRLGQRQCFSLDELVGVGRTVQISQTNGTEALGWISDDNQMIRSPNGAVWIQLNGDVEEGAPSEPKFDVATDGVVETGDIEPE